MKILRLTCAFFAFIVGVGVTIAQSNPPAPSGREAGQPPKQVAQTDKSQSPILQQGTEDSPLVIRLKKTPTDEAEARQDTEKRDGDSTSVRWTMVFTGFQALFALGQVILFYWQLGQIRDSLRHAKDAADAAKDSADAAKDGVQIAEKSSIKQLRAYVSIGWPKANLHGPNTPFLFDFPVVNHGVTPAKNLAYRAIVRLAKGPIQENVVLPEITGDWNDARMNLFPKSELSAEKPAVLNCNPKWIISKEEWERFTNQNHYIEMGIEVRFWDIFDNPQTVQVFYGLPYGNQCWMLPGGSKMT